MIRVLLPIRTVNGLNERTHWSARARRAKAERQAAYLACHAAKGLRLPVYVTMTRIAPRSMDAGCGLNASLKAVRDGIADRLGVNDADPRVTWRYEQRKGKAREYGVEIVLEHVANG